MNRVPARYQHPLIVGVSVAVVLVVAGVVLLAGRVGPTSSPSAPPQASSAPPSPDAGTPEAAARAFFVAFGQASRTDDPTLVLPFVTSDRSPACRSAKGFLDGQRELGRGAVITTQRFENVSVDTAGDAATVAFDYVEGGYLIDLDTGAPLETPNTVPPYRVTVQLERVDGEWLVDSYESRQ